MCLKKICALRAHLYRTEEKDNSEEKRAQVDIFYIKDVLRHSRTFLQHSRGFFPDVDRLHNHSIILW